MLRHLTYKIKSTGPITVAEYMKEVLTNPAKVWAFRRGAFQGKSQPEDLGTDKLACQLVRAVSSQREPLKRRSQIPEVFWRQCNRLDL